MKRLFIIVAAILAAATVSAQEPRPLPNDPEVKVGMLENGMTYYIRHNERPADRAEFYLATDVGAFQETDDQDGLAHFLEHMCFNGTKNFPDKGILNWLQSIGAEFGANINASTGFEQTQYMLNNIPLTRETIVDSCLLILHDYSHFVLCEQEEIDAERGVILEERRTRRNAGWRMYEKSLPYYYGDTPYAKRTLIGGEEQLKTFKRESLVNFYKKWYNPDMQAVIVVGDIDVDQVEAKIQKIFSDIPAPEVPTQKEFYALPENKEPVIGIITDKEAQQSNIEILWKLNPIPMQYNNTDIAFTMNLIKTIVRHVMMERFNDISSKPDAPFLGASFRIGNLCTTADVIMGDVSFKEGEAIKAFTAFLTEIEKMKRYGFTEGELQRAMESIKSSLENEVEAAPTRENGDFIRPLLNNFYKNTPYLVPEFKLDITSQMMPQINSQVIQGFLEANYPTFYSGENMIILYNGPEKEGLTSPTEQEILAAIEAVQNAEIEANAEENINEPLISKTLKGSKVKKSKEVIYGATEWTLKNGVKVVVLPTEYKKDQVIFNLTMDGGKTLISNEDLISFEDNIWGLFLHNTGVSKFPGTTLSKMLAGKNASASPFISGTRHGIQAGSTPKDIETALQLTYLFFTDPRFDNDEYETGKELIRAQLPNLMENPDFKFQIESDKILYGNTPRIVSISEEVLNKSNLETIERVYRELFKDAAGATLYITGNVDLDTLKPLVEKYIGSLPKGKKAYQVNQENVITFARGQINENVCVPMQTPKATVLQFYTAYQPVDTKTEVALELGKYIIDMIYTKKIREQEGGTYGVGVNMAAQRLPEERAMIQVIFDTNTEKMDKLSGLAKELLFDLAENGPDQEYFNMAVENLKKNLPEVRIDNGYWMEALTHWYRFGTDSDAEYEAVLNSVTADDVKNAIKMILDQNNAMNITLTPQE